MSSLRRTALVYSFGRFGLFLVVALLIWSVTGLVGHQINGFPLLLAALLLSSIVGLFVFARQRERFAEALQAKRAAKAQQIADRRARLEGDGGGA
ncbi:MAG: DUF4229 domain-containing protein [Mycobacteriales bacterium]